MTSRVGVHAMSITPFGADGAIDEALFREHLRFIAEHGVGVYVASQGSGEGDLLSFDEKVALYGIAADELRGRVPVVAAGIGLAMSTATTREPSRSRPRQSGVDAVQIIAPRPGRCGCATTSSSPTSVRVIEAVDCEVHVSNNAVLAGYELPIALVETLVDAYPHVRRRQRLGPARRCACASTCRARRAVRDAARGARRHGARGRRDARARRARRVVLRGERVAARGHERVGRARSRPGP